jgi:hypothetical protein
MNNLAYIFLFPNEAAAAYDPIVGQGQYPLLNMVLYDTLMSGVDALQGYWPMIIQPAPLNTAFKNHPNIQLIMTVATSGQSQPNVIFSAIPHLAFLSIITTTGTWARPGLQFDAIDAR